MDAFVLTVEVAHVEGEITREYGILPVVTGEENEVRQEQDFLRTNDRRSFGMLLAKMYDVVSRGDSGGIISGAFEGSLNWAQVDHRDVSDARPIHFHSADVRVGRSGAGHLEVDLGDGGANKARLTGHLTKGVENLYEAATTLVAWDRKATEELEVRAREHLEPEPASPSP